MRDGAGREDAVLCVVQVDGVYLSVSVHLLRGVTPPLSRGVEPPPLPLEVKQKQSGLQVDMFDPWTWSQDPPTTTCSSASSGSDTHLLLNRQMFPPGRRRQLLL